MVQSIRARFQPDAASSIGPIYSEASPEEARSLIDEGVEVSPLPVLPEDRN